MLPMQRSDLGKCLFDNVILTKQTTMIVLFYVMKEQVKLLHHNHNNRKTFFDPSILVSKLWGFR